MTPPEDPRVDLDELERLHREATPGPWEWESFASPDGPRVPQGAYLGSTLITLGDRYEGCDVDCSLVAALRNALPALLTLARRAQSLDAEPTEEELSQAADAMLLVQVATPYAKLDARETYLAMARAALTAGRRK